LSSDREDHHAGEDPAEGGPFDEAQGEWPRAHTRFDQVSKVEIVADEPTLAPFAGSGGG
jgi:hypothetical protein